MCRCVAAETLGSCGMSGLLSTVIRGITGFFGNFFHFL